MNRETRGEPNQGQEITLQCYLPGYRRSRIGQDGIPSSDPPGVYAPSVSASSSLVQQVCFYTLECILFAVPPPSDRASPERPPDTRACRNQDLRRSTSEL